MGEFKMKVDGPTPVEIKKREAEERKAAIAAFVAKGGSIEQCPEPNIPRPNTAR